MKLAYALATVSYSPDLTDPLGTATPIAVLAIGKLSHGDGTESWLAAAAGIDAKLLGLDPLSEAMLGDVPHLIRRHVDSSMTGISAKDDPCSVLSALFESLKTSVHVSEITDLLEATIATPHDAKQRVLSEALSGLLTQVRNILPPAQPAAWRPRVAPSLLAELPEELFWKPPLPGLAASQHSESMAG